MSRYFIKNLTYVLLGTGIGIGIGTMGFIPNSSNYKNERIICAEEIDHMSNVKSYAHDKKQNFEWIIRKELEYFRTVNNIPGLSCVISVDGNITFSYGCGYSNVETLSKCTEYSLFRIASISKIITTLILAKLVDNGVLKFSDNVGKFIKNLSPDKCEISLENLVSNTSGIRHYTDNKSEVHHQNKHYDKLEDCLHLFLNDDLQHKPGEKFTYSTHGFTLLGAIIEKATLMEFKKHLTKLSFDIGLLNTNVDNVTDVKYLKTGNYFINEKGKLKKSHHSDVSWKYPGGGCLSNAIDLVRLGNALLISYQSNDNGYIKRETMKKLWTPLNVSKKYFKDGSGYGLGFRIANLTHNHPLFGYSDVVAFHSGEGNGSSSILYIVSSAKNNNNEKNHSETIGNEPANSPRGIVVVILCNLEGIRFQSLASRLVLHVYDNFIVGRMII